jgi:iron complex outermembrane receptor protein
MAQSGNKKTWTRLSAGVSLLTVSSAIGLASPAIAQEQPAADGDVIVITGYRDSLAAAIQAKREENAIVDVITAEDIADFPDLNLAESLQRVPGVQIDRDGGEGRTINVRGLSSDFVRVRLNGLEALATTGGRDGRQNRNRAFDFNVFASELFNSIKVSKSQSAESEEGSLGATVDLTTARPFDYDGLTFAGGAQVSYNDLAENYDPRYTMLVSDRWLDGQLLDTQHDRGRLELGPFPYSERGRLCRAAAEHRHGRGWQPLLPDRGWPDQHAGRRAHGRCGVGCRQQRRPSAYSALWPHYL